jgi:hypothetical protein
MLNLSRRGLRLLLIGIGAAVVLCLVLTVLMGLAFSASRMPPPPTAMPVVPPTATPDATSVPTDTPTATAAATPVTPTDTPTATPQPPNDTPAATPTATPVTPTDAPTATRGNRGTIITFNILPSGSVVVGQMVKLVAQVTTADGTPVTGTVTFVGSGSGIPFTSPGWPVPASGVVTYDRGFLNAGAYSIYARYEGDPNHDPSTSATVSITVTP